MLAGAQNDSTFGARDQLAPLGSVLHTKAKPIGDNNIQTSQGNLMSSYGVKSSVKFEESPEKEGTAPNVFSSNVASNVRISQDSLIH